MVAVLVVVLLRQHHELHARGSPLLLPFPPLLVWDLSLVPWSFSCRCLGGSVVTALWGSPRQRPSGCAKSYCVSCDCCVPQDSPSNKEHAKAEKRRSSIALLESMRQGPRQQQGAAKPQAIVTLPLTNGVCPPRHHLSHKRLESQ